MDRSGRSSGVADTSVPFRRLVADAAHGPLPALMLVLTVLTGVVDAVSILSLGRVFVANMTGNVVFLGFALAGASGFSLAASLSALGGFLLGAAIGGAAVDRLGSHRGRLVAALAGGELVLPLSRSSRPLQPVPAQEEAPKRALPPWSRWRWARRTLSCGNSRCSTSRPRFSR